MGPDRVGRPASRRGALYRGRVRLTEFWRRMEARFGVVYAGSLAADYRLPLLGRTVNEALAEGVDAKRVWQAVCAEFEMPAQLR
jgi:Protein of unknown function (DUF3046)